MNKINDSLVVRIAPPSMMIEIPRRAIVDMVMPKPAPKKFNSQEARDLLSSSEDRDIQAATEASLRDMEAQAASTRGLTTATDVKEAPKTPSAITIKPNSFYSNCFGSTYGSPSQSAKSSQPQPKSSNVLKMIDDLKTIDFIDCDESPQAQATHKRRREDSDESKPRQRDSSGHLSLSSRLTPSTRFDQQSRLQLTATKRNCMYDLDEASNNNNNNNNKENEDDRLDEILRMSDSRGFDQNVNRRRDRDIRDYYNFNDRDENNENIDPDVRLYGFQGSINKKTSGKG